MFILSDGQLEVKDDKIYVFDPTKGKNILQKIFSTLMRKKKTKPGRFVPIDKLPWTSCILPSSINLNYKPGEITSPDDETFTLELEHDGEVIETLEGAVNKTYGLGHVNKSYEGKIRYMLKRARELYEKKN